jgi:hypothetical protein
MTFILTVGNVDNILHDLIVIFVKNVAVVTVATTVV